MPHASLPEDINALKQLIVEQQARIAAQEEQLNAARKQLLSRDVLIEKLRIELLRLKRMRFGRSSEQLDAKIAQLARIPGSRKPWISAARRDYVRRSELRA